MSKTIDRLKNNTDSTIVQMILNPQVHTYLDIEAAKLIYTERNLGSLYDLHILEKTGSVKANLYQTILDHKDPTPLIGELSNLGLSKEELKKVIDHAISIKKVKENWTPGGKRSLVYKIFRAIAIIIFVITLIIKLSMLVQQNNYSTY